MKFSGKGIIVTGSNSGIGKATALLFAKQGASVLIHGRNLDRLEQTVAECKQIGAENAKFPMVQGDFREKELITKLVQTAVDEFGRIDVLVNNAGENPSSSLLTGTEGDFERLINMALKPQIFLSQRCFPELKKTCGNIVSVSSFAAARPTNLDWSFVTVAHAGLNQFTQCAAIEFGSEGVRVNAVCPGFVKTLAPVKQGDLSVEELDGFYENVSQYVPIKRLGTAEETAKLIVYLASDDASMMNGACIVQDGGHSLMGLDKQTMKI